MSRLKLAAIVLALLAVVTLAACGENEDNSETGGTAAQDTVSGSAVVGPVSGLDIFGSISDEAKAICGSWSYNHDPETPILILSDIGSAVYNNKMYGFDSDGTFITLTSSDGDTQKLRYVVDKDEILLYKTTVYTYDGEDAPDGLVGTWSDKEENWSFEFTESGEFREDGYFPGHVSIDSENGTFKLMYNDHFEDTLCYYQIDGSKLIVEYPWRMVHTTENTVDGE